MAQLNKEENQKSETGGDSYMDEEILREKRARMMNLGGDPAGTGSSAANLKSSADSNTGLGGINPSDYAHSSSGARTTQAPPV